MATNITTSGIGVSNNETYYAGTATSSWEEYAYERNQESMMIKNAGAGILYVIVENDGSFQVLPGEEKVFNTVFQVFKIKSGGNNNFTVVSKNYIDDAAIGEALGLVTNKADKTMVLGEMALVRASTAPILFDMTAKTMTHPNIEVIWRNQKYVIPSGTLDITIGGTRGLMYLDTVTNEVSIYETATLPNVSETEIFLGWYETAYKQAYMNCNWYAVDGKYFMGGDSSAFLGELAVVRASTAPVVFDLGAQTMTHPNMEILYRDTTYVIPAGTEDLTIASARGFVFFNTVTNALDVFGTADIGNIAQHHIFVAWFEKTYKQVYMNCNWVLQYGTPPTQYTYETRHKQIATLPSIHQTFTIIGNEVWLWAGSGEVPGEGTGPIRRYSVDDFSALNSLTHNIGHVGCGDYCIETDTILLGSGAAGSDVIDIYLLENASNLVGQDVNNVELANCITIALRTESKRLGGTGTFGMHAIFGEHSNIVYLGTKNNTRRMWFKCLLGTGTTDLSDSTGTDATKWGTFIAGKSDGEYNGTLKVLKEFVTNDLGVGQDSCYINGSVYMCTGSSDHKIRECKFIDNEIKVIREIQLELLKPDGTKYKVEPEGCALYKGLYLITTINGVGDDVSLGNSIHIMPLYNRQGGVGTIGTPVTFDFPCAAKPSVINITPLSDTVDLYVSNRSTTGFTVESASSGTGTFMWEAPIC